MIESVGADGPVVGQQVRDSVEVELGQRLLNARFHDRDTRVPGQRVKGAAVLVCDQGQITHQGNADDPGSHQRYQQHTALSLGLVGSYSHRFWFELRGYPLRTTRRADSIFSLLAS